MQSSYIKSNTILHGQETIDRFIFAVVIFMMTAYGYLYGLISILPKNYLISIVIFGGSIICTAVLCRIDNAKFEKSSLLWLSLPFFLLLNNQAFVHGQYLAGAREICCIIILLFLQVRRDWVDIVGKCMLIFSIINIFFSWLFYFMPNYYLKNIVPIFPEQSRITLKNNLRHGFLTGITPHYSTNAIYISFALIVFTVYLIINFKDKKRRAILIGLDILSAFTLFMTGKRGSLLATFGAIFLVYLVLQKKNSKKIIAVITAIILMMISVIYALSLTVLPQLANIFERFSVSNTDDMSSGRFGMWGVAFETFKNNFLIGSGWLSFRYKYYSIFGYRLDSYQYLDVHNVYIQLLCEVGLLGFILIVAAMIVTYYSTFKKLLNHNKGEKVEDYGPLLLSLGIQSYMILYSFTGNPLYDPQVYILYFFACAINFSQKSCKEPILKSKYIK